MISSRRASYKRTSLSGQIWRLMASTKLIIELPEPTTDGDTARV